MVRATLSLEERMNGSGEKAKSQLVGQLLKPLVRPRDAIREDDRYLKDDLCPRVAGRLERDGVIFDKGAANFSEWMYSSINKEPLKRVYWGQLNIDGMPREIAQEMTPWAALYFYAGVWIKKSTNSPDKRITPDIIGQNIYSIVRDCVMEGIREIELVHEREYKRKFSAPRALDVRRDFLAPTITQSVPAAVPVDPQFEMRLKDIRQYHH